MDKFMIFFSCSPPKKRMKKKTSKAPQTAVKLKDLKPKKSAKGGRSSAPGNTIGGTTAGAR
ncbi:MAG: hypothetical protein QOE70_5175 [Chthoniobacter sp.]|jgi:hypothetical protein|nr:hypothetical protein [Chthoniobacter sp.]